MERMSPKTMEELGFDVSYEVWQDDVMVASSTDPKDASHYAAVYSQDGPVKVVTVLRSDWEMASGGMVFREPLDPEKWRVVPVDPTPEMTLAFAEVFSVRSQRQTFPAAVRAMVLAAPSPTDSIGEKA